MQAETRTIIPPEVQPAMFPSLTRPFLPTVLAALLFSAGCATLPPPPPPEYADAVVAGGARSAVDAFVLILDASGSMSRFTRIDGLRGPRGHEVVDACARAMIDGIPELDYRAGVRSFGQGSCLPPDDSTLLAGVGRFSRSDAQAAADGIGCPGGPSPLSEALLGCIDDFAGIGGHKSVIVISDGLQMGGAEPAAAKRLHDETGACIYTVQVGESAAGRKMLESIVAAAGCGKLVTARSLEDGRAMGAFITEALLDTSAASREQAPKDSDGDGVYDDRDRCPDTPRGALVDEHGCEVEGVETEDGRWKVAGEVLFEHDSDELKPEAKKILDEIAGFLARNSTTSLTVEGHTDATGPDEYNMDLSLRRARAATDYLESEGIDSARLNAVGKGEGEPVAPNDTPENRAKNRRLEFIPSS